jgi:hypothetical protein
MNDKVLLTQHEKNAIIAAIRERCNQYEDNANRCKASGDVSSNYYLHQVNMLEELDELCTKVHALEQIEWLTT